MNRALSGKILETEQKALEINLDDLIYGAFAEIGAGQEVARHFFQVGAAAGTIAKTMSAYDKVVSDEIYGTEEKGQGRYVCESRLYKMLDHEYDLMEKRLREVRPKHKFFAFADTIAAINFQKTIKGDGWLGLRFQLHPDGSTNDLIVHTRLLDRDNRLQQQAIGILGVNMIYACYRYHHHPEVLLQSLMDNLHGRVMLDMIRLEGPDFDQLDSRLVSLWMVKNNLSDVAIFDKNGRGLHAGEFLYKKPILIARGSYRPPTLVQQDMINNAFKQFKADNQNGPDPYFLTEITLDNLCADGALDERDYMDRVSLLCALGQTVIISNCTHHKKLIAYFSEYKIPVIGLAMGIRKLRTIIQETAAHNQGNLLGAFGELFSQFVRFYVYPALEKDAQTLITTQNLSTPQEVHFLYDHLVENRNIVDIQQFNNAHLMIYHKEVLRMIQEGETGWENMVPDTVSDIIRKQKLFGLK